jgi:hypothetical protein
VRIAYVGGHSHAVGEIEVYWQSRGAIFMHCALNADGQAADLSAILKRADVVFHSLEGIGAETRRYLMAFCERAEKPLIPLAESSLAGLRDALGTWCPLA